MKPQHSISVFILFIIAALTPLACAQDQPKENLVLNSGFEITVQGGAPLDWDSVPMVGTITSTNAYGGAHSLQIESASADYAPYSAQNITTFEAGHPYRLQYDVLTNQADVEYRVYIGLWHDAKKDDPAGTVNGWIDGVNTDWRKGATGWQHVSVDFTPTNKVNRLMVVLQIHSKGIVWFDNVSVAPPGVVQPEATTPSVAVALTPLAKQTVPQGAPSVVKITPDRRFLLNDKPFFPIMIWGWTPYSDEALESARDWGFNVVGAPPFRWYGAGAAQAWLNAAERHNLHGMEQLSFTLPPATATADLAAMIKSTEPIMPVMRSHPALFCYNIDDEPAWAGYDVDAFGKSAQWIKSQDDTHPIFVNHAPRNTIDELKKFNQFIDMAGSDIYPVWKDGIDKHSDLPNKTISVVGDETRKNLEATDYKKPVIETMQGFSWSDNTTNKTLTDEPYPTRSQLRFMAWDSVVAGATGVAWFQDERYKELRPELKPVVHEFASLQNVLAGGEMLPDKSTFSDPIQTIAYKWNGKIVLIAINPTAQTVSESANWKSLFGAGVASMRVLWENRKTDVNKEVFKPFDVHIYTDAAKDTDILRAGFEVSDITAN